MIVMVCCIGIFVFSAQFDVLEKIVHFSERHENWELDEIIPVFIFLTFSTIIILLRRVNEILKTKKELSAQNLQLDKAIQEIKHLESIIPICASCKNIRDDKGYWQQVETYIQNHSETKFTHSICPKCAKKLYPQFYNEQKINS